MDCDTELAVKAAGTWQFSDRHGNVKHNTTLMKVKETKTVQKKATCEEIQIKTVSENGTKMHFI